MISSWKVRLSSIGAEAVAVLTVSLPATIGEAGVLEGAELAALAGLCRLGEMADLGRNFSANRSRSLSRKVLSNSPSCFWNPMFGLATFLAPLMACKAS